MPILPVYRIYKVSVTLWGLKIWVPKPQSQGLPISAKNASMKSSQEPV